MQVSTSSDLSEVSYVLRQNPSEPAFLELFRREQFFIDGVVERGGRYRKVHDRVIRFNVEYYGGGTDMEEDVEGESSWSAGSEGRLPKALRLQLELATSDDPEGEYRLFEQIINLPLGSNMKTTELSPLLASMRQSLSEEGDQAGGDAAGGGAGRRQRGRGGRNNRNNRGQGGDAAEELFGPRRGGGGRDGGRDR
jgi:hypothetical protein